ncbi:hypothetical protein E2C01_038835 [Portunus trituberculatus]|uniref:Uncharacterized protein n=1 Tax=Portunus trituberculatus TaxID=210409 RepID=A0A5B7FJ15_PORTR|nr:hypothetical protein [Portunus trituberculatus]
MIEVRRSYSDSFRIEKKKDGKLYKKKKKTLIHQLYILKSMNNTQNWILVSFLRLTRWKTLQITITH